MSRLDKFLNSWVSKKLSVFVVATVLASVGRLHGSEWANIAIVYIGTQGAVDIFKHLRSNSN